MKIETGQDLSCGPTPHLPRFCTLDTCNTYISRGLNKFVTFGNLLESVILRLH